MASTHVMTILNNFQCGTLNYPTGFRALTTRTLWLILYLFYPFFSMLTFMKTSVINNHIKNVAGRFAGKLYGKCSISLSRYLGLTRIPLQLWGLPLYQVFSLTNHRFWLQLVGCLQVSLLMFFNPFFCPPLIIPLQRNLQREWFTSR